MTCSPRKDHQEMFFWENVFKSHNSPLLALTEAWNLGDGQNTSVAPAHTVLWALKQVRLLWTGIQSQKFSSQPSQCSLVTFSHLTLLKTIFLKLERNISWLQRSLKYKQTMTVRCSAIKWFLNSSRVTITMLHLYSCTCVFSLIQLHGWGEHQTQNSTKDPSLI